MRQAYDYWQDQPDNYPAGLTRVGTHGAGHCCAPHTAHAPRTAPDCTRVNKHVCEPHGRVAASNGATPPSPCAHSHQMMSGTRAERALHAACFGFSPGARPAQDASAALWRANNALPCRTRPQCGAAPHGALRMFTHTQCTPPCDATSTSRRLRVQIRTAKPYKPPRCRRHAARAQAQGLWVCT